MARKTQSKVSTQAPWFVPRGQVLAVRPDLLDALRRLDGKSPREIFTERKTMADGGDLWSPVQADVDADDAGSTEIVSIIGPITQYEGVCDWMFGGTSLEAAMRDLEAAAAEDDCNSIGLYIDSPGGEGPGIADAADRIKEINAIKPIVAFIAGDGCSAAYWLASACSAIVASQTAIVGSVGVRIGYDDYSKADEAAGVSHLEFVSSVSPKKALDPSTAEGKTEIQTIADDYGAVFVEAVAGFRGVTVETVLKDFGQGGVFVGAKSVTAGLADKIGTLNDAIQMAQELAGAAGDDSTTGITPQIKARANAEHGGTMAEKKTAAALLAEHPDATAEIAASAAQAERTRITAILKYNTAANRAIAGDAIDAALKDGKTTAGDLAVAILDAQETKQKAVARARADDGGELVVEEGEVAPPEGTGTRPQAGKVVINTKSVYDRLNGRA